MICSECQVGNLNKVCELLVEEALYAQKQLSMEGAEHAMELLVSVLAVVQEKLKQSIFINIRDVNEHGTW